MQGHGLMQAIARVNRAFRDKPGGLIVDYLGLADQLKHALATYTESGGKGNTTLDTARAIAAMLEKFEVAKSMLHGFDWSAWHTGTQGPPRKNTSSIRKTAKNASSKLSSTYRRCSPSAQPATKPPHDATTSPSSKPYKPR